MNRLNEIEARANAATKGPWHPENDPDEFPQVLGPIRKGDRIVVQSWIAPEVSSGEDAEFIAHARTDVPDMAAALRSVLELHAPDYTYPDCPKCSECPDLASTEARRVAVTWPCPTVEAIRQHLGDDL